MIITVRPDLGPAPEGAPPLQAALDAARPGDVVALSPRRYRRPAIVRYGGTSDAPVVIRGLPGAVIDGGQVPYLTRMTPPRAGGPWPPSRDDFAFFNARSLQNLIFESLTIERCWPAAIYLEDCRTITLCASSLHGGSFGLYVRDNLETGDRSHGFVVEGSSWIQEPALWRDIEWAEAHHGAHTWLNGGLFGSLDIVGDVVFSYKETMRGFGEEHHGVGGPAPMFERTIDADAWALAPDCPGRRRGGALDVAMADGARWLLPAGLDIGALDPTFPIDGPPFRLV